MNLDDFVSETLKQIIKGVVVAQEFGNTCNAKVNPITARLGAVQQWGMRIAMKQAFHYNMLSLMLQ